MFKFTTEKGAMYINLLQASYIVAEENSLKIKMKDGQLFEFDIHHPENMIREIDAHFKFGPNNGGPVDSKD